MKYGGTETRAAKYTIPNHPGDMPEGTLRAILREGKIDVDKFLNA